MIYSFACQNNLSFVRQWPSWITDQALGTYETIGVVDGAARVSIVVANMMLVGSCEMATRFESLWILSGDSWGRLTSMDLGQHRLQLLFGNTHGKHRSFKHHSWLKVKVASLGLRQCVRYIWGVKSLPDCGCRKLCLDLKISWTPSELVLFHQSTLFTSDKQSSLTQCVLTDVLAVIVVLSLLLFGLWVVLGDCRGILVVRVDALVALSTLRVLAVPTWSVLLHFQWNFN